MSMVIDPEKLASFLEIPEAAVEECRCHLTDDGLEIRAVGPATVLMVETTLAAEAFERYEVGEMDIRTIAFEIGDLQDVIGLVDGDSPVSLTVVTDGDYGLRVQSGTLDHKLSLIDPSSVREEPDMSNPDDLLNVSAKPSGGDLSRITKAAKLVSDYVHFGVDTDKGTFVASAFGDSDRTEIELGESDLEGIDIGVDHDVDSMFSLGYIERLSKPISKDDTVEIQVGSDMPMTVDFGFADGHGDARYVIAPRIES